MIWFSLLLFNSASSQTGYIVPYEYAGGGGIKEEKLGIANGMGGEAYCAVAIST